MTQLRELYDLAVIGGGINGTGIACDAAGRGLSVFLCEQDDLASHTSSASSKLIHGGLRYLEFYEFKLVREALAEREVLLKKAPHLITPLRFVLPHRPHLRPAWMIRAGLFLYDHLGKRERLPGSHGIRFDAQSPLKEDIHRGFDYYDCAVDDSRLVIANAQAAREKGAHIHPRTRCVSARRSKGLWHLHLERSDGSLFSLRAKALVNAAGPWVSQVLGEVLKQPSAQHIRLVQGSHLVVPALYPEHYAHILQNDDRRIVFTLPYQQRFTLIGTTDRDYQGDPAKVAINEDEIDYLIEVVNAHFKQPIGRRDLIYSFSGVRPLFDDQSNNPSAVTRDYHLALTDTPNEAPLLSVFGGKLTTYRTLSEAAVDRLKPFFTHMGPSWTANAPLPGAENLHTPEALSQALQRSHPWLPEGLAERWSHSYGSRTDHLLSGARTLEDLGPLLGADLYAIEVDYLLRHEWAMEAEDILWRRSKLGLLFSAAQQQQLGDYLKRTAHKQA